MPVVIDLGAIFVAFCAFIVCWCLLQAYSSTLGALIGHLADVSKSVSVAGVHVFGWLGNGLDKINHFVMLQLGNAVEGTSYAWHKLVGQLAAFIHESAKVLNDLALASAQAWDYAYRHGIRQLIRVYVDPIGSAVRLLQTLVKDLQAASHATTKAVTRVVVHDIPMVTHTITNRVEVRTRTVVKVVGGAVAGTLPRIGALERDVSGLEKWVKANQRRLTEAGAIGLVAAALAKIGLGWTRCRNTNKLGKAVCGMDSGLLDSLLADTTLILGTVSLVEFAEGMQTLVDEIASESRRFWRV